MILPPKVHRWFRHRKCIDGSDTESASMVPTPKVHRWFRHQKCIDGSAKKWTHDFSQMISRITSFRFLPFSWPFWASSGITSGLRAVAVEKHAHSACKNQCPSISIYFHYRLAWQLSLSVASRPWPPGRGFPALASQPWLPSLIS